MRRSFYLSVIVLTSAWMFATLIQDWGLDPRSTFLGAAVGASGVGAYWAIERGRSQ
jgi:hypothetical protein